MACQESIIWWPSIKLIFSYVWGIIAYAWGIWILFVDFSSAFNTIMPDLLSDKLTQLSVPTSICQWITSFLTVRQQLVRLGKLTSRTLTYQHWRPSGLRSLPTALLPLHEWLHFKGPLCQAPEVCGRHYSHRPHQGRRLVCLQTGG